MAPRQTEPAPNVRQRADEWFTPRRFALILAVLIVCTFPGVVFGFETFYIRDFSIFGYPLAFYQRESFWHGEIPLWNPYNFSGLPFLAQWNTMALYPPSLFYLLLPLSWSLGVFCLGHLFFAGLGMYFLAHRWTGNRLAASVAGLAFAFNGLTWNALLWPNNITALAWMPWVVLALERAWHEGGRRVILAGVAGAIQMLTGAPEAIFLTWVFAGALAVVHLARGDVPRLRVCGALIFAVTIVTGLAAAQLLPFLDLLAHSARDNGYADARDIAQWSMPPSGLANYLVPLYHCAPGVFGIYFQNGQGWANSYYLGVGTVALALLAILLPKRGWQTWFLAGVTAFALIMAVGNSGVLYLWIKQFIPALGFMRYPVKFVMLATFAIPLLAGLGVVRFQNLAENERAAGRKRILTLAVLLVAAMALIVWRAWNHPVPGENRLVTLQSAGGRLLFLLPLGIALAATWRVHQLKLQILLRGGILLLFWLDIFTHSPGLNSTLERSIYDADAIRQFFNWDAGLAPGASRAMITPKALFEMFYRTVGDTSKEVTGRRLALFGNLNLLDHAPKIEGFYSLELRRMHGLTERLYATTNDLPRLEDFLGVSKISNPTNAVGWVSRDTSLPMITAGQQPIFAEDADALDAVTSTAFEPGRSVYLPIEARSFITATNGSAAKIISQQFAARRVEAVVEAAAPAMVVVAQAYYHPWRAYVDGQPVRLWPANYAFQALEVPAGTHQVRLVYEDRAFNLGEAISLTTLFSCLVAWWWLGRKSSGTRTAP